jgi:hypothetical protein
MIKINMTVFRPELSKTDFLSIFLYKLYSLNTNTYIVLSTSHGERAVQQE